MHAYRRFVQSEMDRRGWKQSDLARESGVSKQVLSNLLADTRDRLRTMPAEETIAGLARAFRVPESVVLHHVAEAMGLPVEEPVQVSDVSKVSSEDLVRELAQRLKAAEEMARKISRRRHETRSDRANVTPIPTRMPPPPPNVPADVMGFLGADVIAGLGGSPRKSRDDLDARVDDLLAGPHAAREGTPDQAEDDEGDGGEGDGKEGQPV